MNVEMTTTNFIDYIKANYSIHHDAYLLIMNILRYADELSREERLDFLKEMLCDTIGISEDEVKMYDYFHVEG